MPEYVNEERMCPYCSEELGVVMPLEAEIAHPPKQQMECIVNADAWFIPYYAQKRNQ